MNIDEVVNLIEELYSPNPSHDVNLIQQNLQSIQKSEGGYLLANELLTNPAHSTNVKYFGALTFTVQLTTNVDSYETLWKLFKSNLLFLTKYCHVYISDPQYCAPLLTIIKKLMSNLSLIFTNINETQFETNDDDQINQWNNPVNTLLQLLSQCNTVSSAEWTDSPQMDYLFRQCICSTVSYDNLLQAVKSSPACNKVLLTFTQIIVEDLTKFQMKKNQMSKIYEIVHGHLYISTMALINANLTLLHCSEDILFNCISAWINYISMARNVSTHGRMDLSEVFENMINIMCTSTEDTDNFKVAEKLLGIIGSVFANDPTLMSFELRENIEVIFIGVSRSGALDVSKHNWMLQYMNHLVTNEMTEELKELSVCVVDFLQINTLDVCNKLFTNVSLGNVNHDALQQYIKVLLQLTNFPLVPVLQESFSVRMVDFWLDLSEAYTNLSSEMIAEYGPQLATEIFQQVVQTLLPKISLINKQKLVEEDGDETSIHEFDDFRSAVSDLMESIWAILGNDKLTNVFVFGMGKKPCSTNSIGSNGGGVGIFEIEGMAFLLNVLMKDMTLAESPWICDIMDSCEYFVQNTLMLLQQGVKSSENTPAAHNLKLEFVRTSTALLGTLAGYFLQSSSHLSVCIDSLFQALERTISRNEGKTEINDKVEILILNALSTLCDTCRKHLSSSLNKLLNVLNTIMLPDANVSNYTREKLVRSVGYIIESQDSGPEEQANHILHLVTMIENFIRESMLHLTHQPEQRRNYLHCLLSCISELGSAFIRDEDNEDSAYIQRVSQYNQYWNNDPLAIRSKVRGIIDFTLNEQSLSGDPQFMEVSCLILGKALTLPEDEPHFLRYSLSEVMQFILQQVERTGVSISLPYYVYLLERLIGQYKNTLAPQEFDFIFEQVFLTKYNEGIASDPDTLQSTINFVNSILDCKPSLLIYSKHWTTFILPEFLKLLTMSEKFTIVAITKFWTKALNNRKYTQQDSETLQKQILLLGQELVFQTMFGLYHTQRSDINSYADVLRTLVAKYPVQIKTWLYTALPELSSNHAAHEKLINKLLITRGNRAAGNAVLEWWLECNQLPAL